MLKQILVSLSIFLTSHVPAQACTLLNYEAHKEGRAQRIARSGVVIDGIVIQGFNARKHKPEIIKATKVYIGDKEGGTFLISRTTAEFKPPEKGHVILSGGCVDDSLQRKRWKRGERIRQVALIPAGYPPEASTAYYFEQPQSSSDAVARRAQELARANGRLRIPLGDIYQDVNR
ncbi:hypothetical protein [Novosphingobium panipatense]|uniref:Uncharacterized protein n=1 Tax=Novosphingobium panipatense TaxID=428991 RepID=A0ABY1Q4H0_9SPHN|nr:hypothetical protein [Novosphingobium panipatense]SMP57996.1 hypothetical protein SAMN06296065_102390 [Novosphingobium panipatense]